MLQDRKKIKKFKDQIYLNKDISTKSLYFPKTSVSINNRMRRAENSNYLSSSVESVSQISIKGKTV